MDKTVVSNMRRWIDAVAQQNVAGVIPELREFIATCACKKTVNKMLNKLFQHLAHAAGKADRSKIEFGKQLQEIAHLICYSVISVPSNKNFSACIYHISACLVDMNLYYEGMDICDYLLPKHDLCKPDETITRQDMYEPISIVWYKTATNLLNSAESMDNEKYKLFESMVNLDLELTSLAAEDPSYSILSRVYSYSKKVTLKGNFVYNERIKDSLLEHIKKGRLKLNGEKSYVMWEIIMELIVLLIGKDINAQSIGSIAKNYKKYFDAFSSAAMGSEKFSSCFELFESLCCLLLKAVENISPRFASDIDRWLGKFEHWFAVADPHITRCYAYSMLTLLPSVMNYWEKVAKVPKTSLHVTNDMLLSMLKLCEKHGTIYAAFKIGKCRCGTKDCRIENDISNELILKIKCLPLISRCWWALEQADVSAFVMNMIETSLESLKSMKRGSCEQWSSLLQSWGVAVYNMSVSSELCRPTESIKFYTILIKSIVALQGLKIRRNLWSFDDPLGNILHRLSSVCLKSKLYERAKRVAAINCLLSCDVDDTKAYRDWANIKLKDSTGLDATIVQHLRSNELEIPEVDLDDYVLVRVCKRELKALQESRLNLSTAMIAVLRVMESLNCAPFDYAQGVQLLGYHSMSFDVKFSIKDHLRKAASMYGRESSPSINFRCAFGMIKFYEFVDGAKEISGKTEKDMKSALDALNGITSGSESYGRNEADIVPAYSAINMTVTSELESSLKKAFLVWRKIVKSEERNSLSDWEIRYTLHGITIAGEYARLYHFEDLEYEAWCMAYKLANEISDSLSVVYATSRSLTSLNFQPDWIANAEKHVAEMKNPPAAAVEVITRYRLCLANYYYESNEIERADELLVRAKSAIKFMQDDANYLLLKDIEMKYRLGRSDEEDQSAYSSIIVGCLYTLLTMIPATQLTVYECKQKQLHDYSIILDHTNRLALRLNSLLSYREISAHLMDRLGIAQRLVTSLRVAECLKFLCYIDLSRGKLDECEVKLQGLEHILEIEAFDATMKSKLSPYRDTKGTTANFTNSTRYVDAVRDVGQSDASPILRKKVFAKPDFMLHGENCSCFKCRNTCYQHLVWASTHIRAQLFALQANSTAAFQHFHGAMRIRKCILTKHEAAETARKSKTFSVSRALRRGAIEYVMFHLDYCRFLEWSMPDSDDRVRDIALDALELCGKYNLRNHPVWVSVNELLFQWRFKNVFTKDDYSKFMVPDISKIDVSRYELGPAPDPTTCVTPVREIIESRPISVRRRKTPPFLKLDRVPGDLDDEKTPIASKANLPMKNTRRLRRKICEDEDYCDDQSENEVASENVPNPNIIISVPVGEGKKADDLPKRGTRRKNSVVKVEKTPVARIKREPAGKMEKKAENYPLAIAEATNLIANLELETKVGVRKKAQRVVAGNEGKSSTNSLKKMGVVAGTCNDKSTDKEKQRKSPVLSSSVNSGIVADISDQSFVLSSDVSVSSEAEDESTIGQRGRTRLRKKVRDLIQNSVSKSVVSEPNNSEAELGIVTRRSARRLNALKEQNIVATNVVRKSRDATRKTKDG